MCFDDHYPSHVSARLVHLLSLDSEKVVRMVSLPKFDSIAQRFRNQSSSSPHDRDGHNRDNHTGMILASKCTSQSRPDTNANTAWDQIQTLSQDVRLGAIENRLEYLETRNQILQEIEKENHLNCPQLEVENVITKAVANDSDDNHEHKPSESSSSNGECQENNTEIDSDLQPNHSNQNDDENSSIFEVNARTTTRPSERGNILFLRATKAEKMVVNLTTENLELKRQLKEKDDFLLQATEQLQNAPNAIAQSAQTTQHTNSFSVGSMTTQLKVENKIIGTGNQWIQDQESLIESLQQTLHHFENQKGNLNVQLTEQQTEYQSLSERFETLQVRHC